MRAPALKLVFVAAVVAASIAAPVLVQRQASARLREKSEILDEQAARATQLAIENQRVSNLVAQVTQSFSDAQLKELLQLRGQVGALRKTAAEAEQLRATLNANR